MSSPTRLLIISGLSGSGKSIALHVLEDLGYYCIDNMPAALLDSLIGEVTRHEELPESRVAVSIDARDFANQQSMAWWTNWIDRFENIKKNWSITTPAKRPNEISLKSHYPGTRANAGHDVVLASPFHEI